MKAKMNLCKEFQVCEIDERIYGSFVEHMGRCVYNGIYEPTHETADAMGFRNDVKEMVKDLNVSLIRYPGGNFVSGYRWEDGVGPKENRPKVLDAAWAQMEPNEVGTDEFHAWAEELGIEVMMAVNLGTRGPEEAGQLLEYCNLDTDTRYANMRVENGHKEPYRDTVWCLGNEMDGLWQIGARTPDDYADIARKTAIYMKMLDPTIECVACGSANHSMETFGVWEQAVLEKTYEHIDYLSLHLYSSDFGKDDGEYLGASVDMDKFIHTVVSICDAVGGKKHHSKKIHLAFDEWNVWPMLTKCDNSLNRWEVGPAREEYRHSLLDTLVFGSMLNSLIRNADRVKIACFAQLVNVGGLIMTVNGGAAWKQPTYYAFQYASKYGRGKLLDQRMDCPEYQAGKYGNAPYLDSVAIYNEDTNEVTLFVISRSQEEEIDLQVQLTGFGECSILEHVVLESEDCHWVNSAENPELIAPQKVEDRAEIQGESAVIKVKPLTWNMIRIGKS